jgi:glycogen(starch) synthase
VTLRVLHFSYHDLDNPWVSKGRARRLYEIYRRLREKVEVTIVTGRYPGAQDLVREGVQYRRIGGSRPYLWSLGTFVIEASRLIRQSTADVVVVDISPYTPIWLSKGCRVAVTSFAMSKRQLRKRGGIERILSSWEHYTVRESLCLSAHTEASASVLHRVVGFDRDIAIIGIGVSPIFFTIGQERENGQHNGMSDQEWRLPTDEPYLLYVGRLDIVNKGIDTALVVLAQLKRDGLPIPLHIAGSGPDEGRIRALAARLGVQSLVHMLGDLNEEQLAAAYAKACLQLVPSRFGTFCMAAAEGMAAGVPIVGTNIPVLTELVGDAGVLVPPDDIYTLANTVTTLMSDSALRQQYTCLGRMKAATYTWDHVATAHYQFLQRAAEQSQSHST